MAKDAEYLIWREGTRDILWTSNHALLVFAIQHIGNKEFKKDSLVTYTSPGGKAIEWQIPLKITNRPKLDEAIKIFYEKKGKKSSGKAD
jgi:hypothetical protein